MLCRPGSGSDEDNQLYLKYYADEEWRERWHKDWPNDVIPPHVMAEIQSMLDEEDAAAELSGLANIDDSTDVLEIPKKK